MCFNCKNRNDQEDVVMIYSQDKCGLQGDSDSAGKDSTAATFNESLKEDSNYYKPTNEEDSIHEERYKIRTRCEHAIEDVECELCMSIVESIQFWVRRFQDYDIKDRK